MWFASRHIGISIFLRQFQFQYAKEYGIHICTVNRTYEDEVSPEKNPRFISIFNFSVRSQELHIFHVGNKFCMRTKKASRGLYARTFRERKKKKFWTTLNYIPGDAIASCLYAMLTSPAPWNDKSITGESGWDNIVVTTTAVAAVSAVDHGALMMYFWKTCNDPVIGFRLYSLVSCYV